MKNHPQWHYTDKTGQQAGPVPTNELLKLIDSKEAPMSTMVWKDGMPTWKPISQVQELLSTPVVPPAISSPSISNETASASLHNNIDPYATPQSGKLAPPPDSPLSYNELHGIAEHDGIGRLSYILVRPLLYLVCFVPLALLVAWLDSQIILAFLAVALIALLIRLHCLRFKNIGMNPWWTAALIVPVLGWGLNLMLIACPAGYAQTRQLDIPGKIISTLYVGFVVLYFAFAITLGFAGVAEKLRSDMQGQHKTHEGEKTEEPLSL